MKQKIKKIIVLSVITLISTVFLRCQKDDDLSNQPQEKIQTVSIDEAKDFLQYLKTNSFGKSTNDKLENLDFNKITQEKINGSSQLLTVIPLATNDNLTNDRILLLKVNNKIKSAIFSMYRDENSISGSFSGTLFSYSLDGDFISGFRAENGVIVSKFIENNNATARAIQLKEVVVENKLDYALDVFGYSTIFGGDIYGGGYYYNGVDYYSWDAGREYYSEPTSTQIAMTLEKQIDGNNLDPCTKSVLDKLKKMTQNDIANIFETFGVPINGTYNLKIILGKPDSSGALADTRWVSKNNYLITIRETYVKGTYNNGKRPTDLAIAAVMIHEIIHAHFYALFDDFHNNGDICAYDKYDCLFMEYVSKNFEGTTDPQHAQMFENYIDVMANTLQEFQTGIAVSNKEKAELFYHDLALSTLGGTQIFKDRYPLNYSSPTYDERRRIVNNRTAEDNNVVIDDAEKGKYTPKGNACTK